MHADIKGALNQIENSWSYFLHRGKQMTKEQVKLVLTNAIEAGYRTTNEIPLEKIDAWIGSQSKQINEGVWYKYQSIITIPGPYRLFSIHEVPDSFKEETFICKIY